MSQLKAALRSVLGEGKVPAPEPPAPLPAPANFTIPLVRSTMAVQAAHNPLKRPAPSSSTSDALRTTSQLTMLLQSMNAGVPVSPELLQAALSSVQQDPETPAVSDIVLNPPTKEVTKRRQALDQDLKIVRSFMEDHGHWEAPEERLKQLLYERFLLSTTASADLEADDESPDSIMGVPAPDDIVRHIRAVYEAPPTAPATSSSSSSRKKDKGKDPVDFSPFAQIVRIWPQTYAEICDMEAKISVEDLAAFRLTVNRLHTLAQQCPAVSATEANAIHVDHLTTARQTVKLASASLAYVQAVGRSVETVSSKVQEAMDLLQHGPAGTSIHDVVELLQVAFNANQVTTLAAGAANTAAFAAADVGARAVRRSVRAIRTHNLVAMLSEPGTGSRIEKFRDDLVNLPIVSGSLFGGRVMGVLASHAVRNDNLDKMLHAIKDPAGPALPLARPPSKDKRHKHSAPFRGQASSSSGGGREARPLWNPRSSSRSDHRRSGKKASSSRSRSHRDAPQQPRQQQSHSQSQAQQQPRRQAGDKPRSGGSAKGRGRGRKDRH